MGGGDDGPEFCGRGDTGDDGRHLGQAHGIGQGRLHRIDAGFGQTPPDARQGRRMAVPLN
jgi:hypothetical protein